MPPASPAVILVLRKKSRIEVLPWSTWPMMVTMGGRFLRRSSGSSTGASGSLMTSSTLWKPLSLSRFSRSKVKPWISQILAAISGSSGWLGAGKTPILIRSAMMLNGLSPRRAASSGTRIGGLMTMSFGSSENFSSGMRCLRRRGDGGRLPSAGAARGALTMAGSSRSRILEIEPRTFLPAAAGLRTLGFFSSEKRSSASLLALSSLLGAGGDDLGFFALALTA